MGIRINQQVIFGWVNYFKIANTKKIGGVVGAKLRSRLRVILWKAVEEKENKISHPTWHTDEETKGLIYCRKGDRFIGLPKVVQRALYLTND